MLPARVLRVAAQSGVAQRALTTSAVSRNTDMQLSQADKDKYYPKVGGRDIVGWGFNGSATYIDKEDYPAPAIRFQENNSDILALRTKEQGDWKNLSLDEKKTLYRASFCQTYAEMTAPTGEWKAIVAGIIFGFSLTSIFMIYLKTYVYPPKPHTITEEWMHKNLERMVRQGQGPIEGVASKWDYEKNEWK